MRSWKFIVAILGMLCAVLSFTAASVKALPGGSIDWGRKFNKQQPAKTVSGIYNWSTLSGSVNTIVKGLNKAGPGAPFLSFTLTPDASSKIDISANFQPGGYDVLLGFLDPVAPLIPPSTAYRLHPFYLTEPGEVEEYLLDQLRPIFDDNNSNKDRMSLKIIQTINLFLRTNNPKPNASPPLTLEERVVQNRGLLKLAFSSGGASLFSDPMGTNKTLYTLEQTREALYEAGEYPAARAILALSVGDQVGGGSHILASELLYSERRGFNVDLQHFSGTDRDPSGPITSDIRGYGAGIQFDLKPKSLRQFETDLDQFPCVIKTRLNNLQQEEDQLLAIAGISKTPENQAKIESIRENITDANGNLLFVINTSEVLSSDLKRVLLTPSLSVGSGYRHFDGRGDLYDIGIGVSQLFPVGRPERAEGVMVVLQGQAAVLSLNAGGEVTAPRLSALLIYRDGVPYRGADQKVHTDTWHWQLGVEYNFRNAIDQGDAYRFFVRARSSRYWEYDLSIGKRADYKDYVGFGFRTYFDISSGSRLAQYAGTDRQYHKRSEKR